MEIRRTIRYTAKDIQLGYSLHLRKYHFIKSNFLLLLGILIVLLGIMLVILQSISGYVNWFSWGFIVYGVVIILYYKWKYNSMGRNAYKKLTNFHDPFEFIFSEERIITVGKNTTTESSWDHYCLAVVTDKMILLYPNNHTFIILPGKCFSDDEYAMLSLWVRNKIRSK